MHILWSDSSKAIWWFLVQSHCQKTFVCLCVNVFILNELLNFAHFLTLLLYLCVNCIHHWYSFYVSMFKCSCFLYLDFILPFMLIDLGSLISSGFGHWSYGAYDQWHCEHLNTLLFTDAILALNIVLTETERWVAYPDSIVQRYFVRTSS